MKVHKKKLLVNFQLDKKKDFQNESIPVAIF